MTNYYEALKITPNASSQDIETVIDRLYDETRRRVTSFDPQVAAQANQSLQWLEQMRSILLTPERRAAYDAALGIGEGGLIDPEALFPTSTSSSRPALGMPSVPMQFGQTLTGVVSSVPAQSMARTDAWICPTCRHANLVGAQFCAKDGTKVGHSCPHCNTMSELSNDFCPSCGSEKRKVFDALKQAEINHIQAELRRINDEIACIEKTANRTSTKGLTERETQMYRDLREEGAAKRYGFIAAFMIFLLLILLGFSISSTLIGSILFLFLFIVSAIASYFIYSRIQKNQARKTAHGMVNNLHLQIPPLQRQIVEVQSRQYPGK